MRTRKPGIYSCITTGIPYIGSTVNTDYRIHAHLKSLREGKHHSVKLQRAWNKYGEPRFVASVLEKCVESDLLTREQFYIEAWDSYTSGYNCTPKAGATRGVVQRPESIVKRKATMIERYGAKSPMQGKKHSEQTKALIRKARAKQSPPSPEFRELLSQRMKGNTLRVGTKHPQQWCDHMAQIMKGRHTSPDSELKQGHVKSSETLAKISAALRWRSLSKDHCQKLSKAHKGLPGNNIKTYTLTSPQGETTTITNLKRFCEKHGLSAPHLNSVFHGKRKQHKGWTR